MPPPSSTPASTGSLGTTSKCQCAPWWSQAFTGVGPSTARSRLTVRRRSRTAEARSSTLGLGVVRAGRDQDLVWSAARWSGAQREVPVDSDLERVVGEHVAQRAGAVDKMRQLAFRLGRGLLEPDELGVAVRQARARFAAFVEEEERVVEAGLACRAQPLVPRDGDRAQFLVVELGKRSHVARRVDDHLLVLERGIEVRNDAHLPAGGVGSPVGRRHGEDFGRRSVLAPLVEGALLELCRRSGRRGRLAAHPDAWHDPAR